MDQGTFTLLASRWRRQEDAVFLLGDTNDTAVRGSFIIASVENSYAMVGCSTEQVSPCLNSPEFKYII